MRFHARHDSFSPVAAGGLAAACGLILAACASTTPSSAAAPTAPSAPSTAPSTASSTGPSTGAAATTTAPRSAPAGGGGECTASQLKVSLVHTGAAAGQAGGYLEFSNDSSTSCQMTGWPSVTGLTAAGKATPMRHAQSTMYGAWQRVSPAPVLTLGPGDAAYAVVVSDDLPANNAPSCPDPYTHLRVSPPASSAGVVISAWLPGARTYLPSCTSATGSPTAQISTITALSSLPH